LIFTNLDVMIKSLLIGSESDVVHYSKALSQSKFFKSVDQHIITNDGKFQADFEMFGNYDAIFLIGQLQKPFLFFSECIKTVRNLYFIDQPNFTNSDIENLEQLYSESGGLIFPELTELNHPLVEEFIEIEPHQLHYNYTKSIAGKKDIRLSLLTALGFLSLLSPMPVKKIEVGTFETTRLGRPSIKVRLKLYDSSVCNILLDIDNKNEHIIAIESPKGNFIFNLTENFLENIHGSKFKTEEVTNEILLERTLNSFAMNIILNTKPVYSFQHYLSVISQLQKIENILKNSF
jgi:hypothetical protein